MAEYLAPGVYVEEVSRGAAPLAGVSMSTAGFLGPTERGPTDPRLLTSFADYERTYGGHLPDSYLTYAVQGFFANGGSRCYVGRIASEDDDEATGIIPSGPAYDSRQPLLAVDESLIDFEEVGEGQTGESTVRLIHDGDEDDDPLEIVLDDHADLIAIGDDIDFDFAWDDGTAAGDPMTIDPESDEELTITFEPAAETDPGEVYGHWARLVIDPEAGVFPVAVDLIGFNSDASDDDKLTTADTAIDFGDITGDSATVAITVDNEATQDVNIDITDSRFLGEDRGAFSLDHTGSVTVDENDSATVDIVYEPDDSGPHETALVLAHDGDSPPILVSITANTAGIRATAVGPGSWGGHIAILVEEASMYEEGKNELFKLIIRYWADDESVIDAKANAADPDEGAPDPAVEEVFDDLSPDGSSSNYYVKQVNDVSMLLDLKTKWGGRPAPDSDPLWLDDPGDDTDLERGDYEGDAKKPPEERTGFAGFEKLDEVAIICVPDEHDHDVTDILVDHCEEMDDRFAILQADRNPGQVGNLRPPFDTDMAAFYYPWLEVINPTTGMTTDIPPGGHVAGIYARSDSKHGVHKAPANEVVRGIQGLQRTITKGEQEVLNPRGVNCIRGFRGRGIRVWGARTASSDPSWKYVNVRRLFLFLRQSIEEGTQWVVFEPNNEELWARVTQTIKNFLTDVWQDGALMGTSPDEAFFVKCDRSTMTQSDIENGRLICEIGVAPVRPAEFVIFRISQWTAEGG